MKKSILICKDSSTNNKLILQEDENILIIYIIGSMTFRLEEYSRELFTKLKEYLEKTKQVYDDIKIVFDFKDCNFLDSFWLGVLVTCTDEIPFKPYISNLKDNKIRNDLLRTTVLKLFKEE